MVTNNNSYYQTYIDTGEGQVVILLHGIFGNVYVWKPLVEALKSSYRVIVPRLPLSSVSLEHANGKPIADVLHGFIQHHALQNVTLVGHAAGAQLALVYTHLYPGNVKKLILVASGGLMERGRESESPGFGVLQNELEHAHYFKGQFPETVLEEIHRIPDDLSKQTTAGEMSLSLKHVQISGFLTRIDHPVLLVWGLNDQVSPPEAALHFNDLLSNSEIRFIENCGHVPMVEKPDQFVAHVLAFLKPSAGSAWHSQKH